MAHAVETFAYVIRVTEDHRLLVEGGDGEFVEIAPEDGSIPVGDSESLLEWAMKTVADVHDASGGNMELKIEDLRDNGYGTKKVMTAPGGNITIQDLRKRTGRDLSSISAYYAGMTTDGESSDGESSDPHATSGEDAQAVDAEPAEAVESDADDASGDQEQEQEQERAPEDPEGTPDPEDAPQLHKQDDTAPAAQGDEFAPLPDEIDAPAPAPDDIHAAEPSAEHLDADVPQLPPEEPHHVEATEAQNEPLSQAQDPQEYAPPAVDSYAQDAYMDDGPFAPQLSDEDDEAYADEFAAAPAPEPDNDDALGVFDSHEDDADAPTPGAETTNEEDADHEERPGGIRDRLTARKGSAKRRPSRKTKTKTAGKTKPAGKPKRERSTRSADKPASKKRASRKERKEAKKAIAGQPVEQRIRPGWTKWDGRRRPELGEDEIPKEPVDPEAKKKRRRNILIALGALLALLIGLGIWVNTNPNTYAATCMDERTMSRHATIDACENEDASYYRWWYTPRGSEVPAVGQTVDPSQGSKMEPGGRAIIHTDWEAEGGTVGGES